MIDGCPDGWAGTGIPVCVLASGTAQQENNSTRASRDGTMMKERDYIGLGLAAPEEGLYVQNGTALQSAQDKMECDNVELSLGLGLPDKASQQSSHVEQLNNSDHSEAQAKLKLAASPAAKSQHFWHHTFRVNLNNNDHLQAETSTAASLLKSYTSNVPAWSTTPGRFTVPVPKVSTIPAKRPFLEAVGDRRSLPTASNHAAAPEAVLPCAMPVPSGTYTWNVEPSASIGGVWQQGTHVSIEQGCNHPMGSGVGSAFVHSRQLSALPPPPSPHFKVPQAGVGAPLPPPAITSSMAPNGAGSSSQVVEVAKPEMENENRNKAPVVGWPPVRSFRKNTLQAAQSNRMNSEDLQPKSAGGPTSGTTDGLEQVNGNNSKNAFFVKAKLDGVRICRKVDLKAYDSYDGLKSALQEMFQGFVSDNAKLDLRHGNNYVVTHEDKDGDCLLVGDVPWPMFVESSVKSLRIMKSMDAISIGDKASAKLKAQANGNP